MKDVTEVMNEISSGNLNVAVKGSYKGDFDQLSQSVNTTAKLLNIVVGEITQTIVQIADGKSCIRSCERVPRRFCEHFKFIKCYY